MLPSLNQEVSQWLLKRSRMHINTSCWHITTVEHELIALLLVVAVAIPMVENVPPIECITHVGADVKNKCCN